MFSCLEYGSKFSHCQRNCCNKGASDWLRQLKQVSPHTLKMPWLKGYCFYLPKDSRSCFKRPGLDHFGTLCIHLFWNLQCIRGYQEVMPSWATTPPPNDDVTSGRPLILKLLFFISNTHDESSATETLNLEILTGRYYEGYKQGSSRDEYNLPVECIEWHPILNTKKYFLQFITNGCLLFIIHSQRGALSSPLWEAWVLAPDCRGPSAPSSS